MGVYVASLGSARGDEWSCRCSMRGADGYVYKRQHDEAENQCFKCFSIKPKAELSAEDERKNSALVGAESFSGDESQDQDNPFHDEDGPDGGDGPDESDRE